MDKSVARRKKPFRESESLMESNMMIGPFLNSRELQEYLTGPRNGLADGCTVLLDFEPTRLDLSLLEGVVNVMTRTTKGLKLVRGEHPRRHGFWPQYGGAGTALRDFVVISDVVDGDSTFTDFSGEERSIHDIQPGTDFSSENYRDAHNHYQTLLAEVWNYRSSVNAVAVCGDSAALGSGSGAWGGFFAARSWPWHKSSEFEEFSQVGIEQFDARLIGLEVDVLNYGKPWFEGGQQEPKIGAQIVGFGHRNTCALEIRTEDSDVPLGGLPQRGQFAFGVLARNCFDSNSVVFSVEQREGSVSKGIDLSGVQCDSGALILQSGHIKDGIRIKHGDEEFSLGIEEREGVATAVMVVPSGGLVIQDSDGHVLLELGQGFASGGSSERPT